MSNIVVSGQLPEQVFRLRRKTTYRAKKNLRLIGINISFGVNHGSPAVIGDLCETQTAECGVSRKRVIGVCFLLELIARGENRLFSPEEVRPICFCGSSLCTVRKADSFQSKSFACGERRFKSKKKSRLAGIFNKVNQ